jgi:hypothetical protein
MKSTILSTCLALIVAGAGRAEPSADPYPAAYAASLSDHVPLLVFVGQPAREVTGMRSISVATFPEATAPSVVVGIVYTDGQMYRKDLSGTATAQDIQAAVSGQTTSTSFYRPSNSAEALDEVNAARAARGLRPYIRDAYLTAGAMQAAEYRAARLIEGHTPNDFAALPPGGFASSAGCAAWEPGMGWGSCCTYENHTYAGAAYAYGRDGRRYMHLFVR